MSRKFSLSRRTVLKASGAVLGLPLLEAMLDASPAAAQTVVPKRYLLTYGGHSLGAESAATLLGETIPATAGTNYALPFSMQALAAVKAEFAVISGLKVPTTADMAGTLPPGGKAVNFHHHGLGPTLSGVKSPDDDYQIRGPTSDQLLVALLAGTTTFKSLSARVQVTDYVQQGGDGVPVSWKKAVDGSIQRIVPTVSPRQLFNALFSNFTPGLTQAEKDRQKLLQDGHASVVDRVKLRAEALKPKLGVADQRRLDLHLAEVRDLERRIVAIPPPIVGMCVKPMDPGVDPVVAGGQAVDGDGNITYNQNNAYSGEDARAKAMCDLLHMAMVCDLTRIATLQLTMVQSFLNAYPLIGQRSDLHELSHGGFGNLTVADHRALALGIAWHMKHWGYLIQKFRDTSEAGGSMLDNMALVYANEGGHGFDPSSGKNNSPHSTEKMMVLVAGRAGGLKGGQHLVATGKHPANAILTAMRAVGYTPTNLGDISGEIAGLR